MSGVRFDLVVSVLLAEIIYFFPFNYLSTSSKILFEKSQLQSSGSFFMVLFVSSQLGWKTIFSRCIACVWYCLITSSQPSAYLLVFDWGLL